MYPHPHDGDSALGPGGASVVPPAEADDQDFVYNRNPVHLRSQSMLDRLVGTGTGGGGSLTTKGVGAVASNSAAAAAAAAFASVDGAQGEELAAGALGSAAAASELVRRHHTLSTSSTSRLVRLERNKARLALQGVGLSEEDQEWYVPPSPVKAIGGWSDAGHGQAATAFAGSRHSLAVPPIGSAGTSSLNRSSSNGSSVGAGGSSAWSGSDSTVGAGMVDSLSTVATTSATAKDDPNTAFHRPKPVATTQAANKRSSFVVVRGGKGDAELTTRKQDVAQSVTQPWTSSSDSDVPLVAGGAGSTTLRHKNSLKPFLDAEQGENGEEEWERSLKDERNKEEMELYAQDSFQTPPLLSSGTFESPDAAAFSHSRASTYQQPGSSADPWSLSDESATVRRHQSLNSFRPSATTTNDSAASSISADDWAAHSRLASGDELLAPLPSSFAKSRAGTSPAPLSLSHSNHAGYNNLGHSHSLNLGSRSSHAPAGLTHSNSLDRGTFDRSALSPVGGFVPSPWSPTAEESRHLGLNAAVGGASGITRGNSTSSRSSRFDDDLGRLGEEMAQLQVGDGTSDVRAYNPPRKTPPGFEAVSNEQSPFDVGASPGRSGHIGRSLTSATSPTSKGRLTPLMTNLDGGPDGLAYARQGPASASAFVPPIGHSHLPASTMPTQHMARPDYLPSIAEPDPRVHLTAVPGPAPSDWARQKEMLVGGGPVASAAFPSAVGVNGPVPGMPPAPPGAAEGWPAGGGFGVGIAMQQQQQIQMLQHQMQQALTAMDMMRAQGVPIPAGFPALGTAQQPSQPGQQQVTRGGPSGPGSLLPAQHIGQAQVPPAESPVDVSALIAAKGYNPSNFDLRPTNARFFVIKSYTEEDVHKSLKYEIWASTDLGNKRLDRAFRESADKGPIYLFFSVNGSGHFAGMAQMLTPVDYQTSSNVWASDKWKGVLKVRWIYIKDVPLSALRHIRLSNTPENKPVTSSRDTQEVPYDAGLEVLRILATYQSRTSLLQDYAWYEARQANGTGDEKDEKRAPHYNRSTASPQPGAHVGPRTSSPFASPQQPAMAQSRSPVPFASQMQQYAPSVSHANGPVNGHVAGYPGPTAYGISGSPQQQPHPPQQAPKNGGRRFFSGGGGSGGGGYANRPGGSQVF